MVGEVIYKLRRACAAARTYATITRTKAGVFVAVLGIFVGLVAALFTALAGVGRHLMQMNP